MNHDQQENFDEPILELVDSSSLSATHSASHSASHSDEEITLLVTERFRLRQCGSYAASDVILANLHKTLPGLRIYDRRGGLTEWEILNEQEGVFNWSGATYVKSIDDDDVEKKGKKGCKQKPPPIHVLTVLTVDAPHYKSRLEETIPHLEQLERETETETETATEIATETKIEIVNLYDLTKFRSTLCSRTVLFAGWRDILIPRLIASTGGGTTTDMSLYVLCAEDDIRLTVPIKKIHTMLETIFRSPSLPDVVSLGHSYARLARGTSSSPLLPHLLRGKKLHASTLIAVRAAALPRMLGVMQNSRATHFDQFLFHEKHELTVAVSDPPVAGWAEVGETLTSASNGGRRPGGGRNEFLPPTEAEGEANAEGEGSFAFRKLSEGGKRVEERRRGSVRLENLRGLQTL
ncbi:hypothetical protein ScalyP_jg11870 [Parmales sp. scaly parma]|nr:hypothetical protein ScalyP_jg11870 [Parmales sp. scaly parma]